MMHTGDRWGVAWGVLWGLIIIKRNSEYESG